MVCSAWVTGDEVAECCEDFAGGSNTGALDSYALAASEVLNILAGGELPGECSTTVRPPNASHCSCWYAWATSIEWTWTGVRWGGAGGFCGCPAVSEIVLAGAPIREVTEVKIDGVVIDPSGYSLIAPNRLVRMRDPADPTRPVLWPGCQNLALEDTEAGTWSVAYTYGPDIPQFAKDAAVVLACQMYVACLPSDADADDCELPIEATRVIRQGITFENANPIAAALRKGETGIPAIDFFVASFGGVLGQRSSVWSPDMPYPDRAP